MGVSPEKAGLTISSRGAALVATSGVCGQRANKKPRAAPSPSRGVARGFDPFTDGDENVREVRFRLHEVNYSTNFSSCEDISREEKVFFFPRGTSHGISRESLGDKEKAANGRKNRSCGRKISEKLQFDSN
ncbi:hypothetical protein [Sutterella megalosphaeroides]|uniref:hypothetical protein n=1 Tax=Sutterella megalosphaeroides TaxID=2494234 RepID=UPI00147564B1|nr:hypothetical protein [Sutterella megalosphaeroides]